MPRRLTMSWQRCDPDPSRGLVAPRSGPGVCTICFNLIDKDRELCRACLCNERHADLVVPISYSLGGGWLHTELAAYKRDADQFVPAALQALSVILDRFLSLHEKCVAEGAGIALSRFDLVTTVPSGDRRRDIAHPLRRIVGALVPATRERYERLLVRSTGPSRPHSFDASRFEAARPLSGERVLLIDDMWTTGASVQGAAAALRRSGASTVAAVVMGRHLNRGYGENDVRIRHLGSEFDWSTCAICERPLGSRRPEATKPAAGQLAGGGSAELQKQSG